MDENETAEEPRDDRVFGWIECIPAALGIRLL